jgi:hypothetical protein
VVIYRVVKDYASTENAKQLADVPTKNQGRSVSCPGRTVGTMVLQLGDQNGCFVIGCNLCLMKHCPFSISRVILIRQSNLPSLAKKGWKSGSPALQRARLSNIIRLYKSDLEHCCSVFCAGRVALWSILHEEASQAHCQECVSLVPRRQTRASCVWASHGSPQRVKATIGVHPQRPPSSSSNLLRPLVRLVLLYLIFIHPLSHQHFKVPNIKGPLRRNLGTPFLHSRPNKKTNLHSLFSSASTIEVFECPTTYSRRVFASLSSSREFTRQQTPVEATSSP